MERARGAELEDLLARSDWLTRLARRLTGADEAEDVVQETWLAARRSPPDPERPPRPWLQGVLRNLVRARWQSDRRRRRREQAQALLLPDRAAAVDTLYERVEMQRLVAERVMALEPPLRTVVLLRYFEGHDSTHIADLLGVAPGTVRWRLKQAIDRLREQMDARFHGDRQAWALALAPGAAPRPAVTTAAGSWTPFSVVVSGGLFIALGAAMGAGVGVWTAPAGARIDARDATASPARVSPTDPGLGSAGTVAGGTRLRATTPFPRRARPGTLGDRPAGVAVAGSVGGHLGRAFPPSDAIAGMVFADGHPEDDAIVVATAVETAAAPASDGALAPPARARTADGGLFLLAPLRPGRYHLTASGHDRGSARSAVIDLPAGHALDDVVLDLRAAPAGLAGRVVDSTGVGISRARVRARAADPSDRAAPVFEAESACLGRYHLDLAAGLYTVEIEAPGHPPARFSLPVPAPLVRDLRLAPSTAPPTGVEP